MLPKDKKLPGWKIPIILKQGRRRDTALFSLCFLAEGDHPAAAVVVSTKVSKKAVIRNRIKRRVYSALDEIWSVVKPGSQLVFFAKLAVLNVDFAKLKKEIESALQQ